MSWSWTMLAALALVSAASLIGVVWLWGKLRQQHRRSHLQSMTLASISRQLVHVSRSAARAEARARLGSAGEMADPHAQHGEELFLWEFCDFKTDGVFVEIGAYDGIRLSNSLFFEQIGWKGLLVEAHPDLAAQCRVARPAAKVVHAALGAVDAGEVTFSMVRGPQGLDTLSFVATTAKHRQRIEAQRGRIEEVVVPARTLSSVLAQSGIESVDWMSIDVEGAELDVLKGAGLEFIRPTVVMVEDNSGGLDQAVASYLAQFGYRRLMTVGCNDLYCINE